MGRNLVGGTETLMKPNETNPETLLLWVALAVVGGVPSAALVLHLIWKFSLK
jgi:hypothetical protein